MGLVLLMWPPRESFLRGVGRHMLWSMTGGGDLETAYVHTVGVSALCVLMHCSRAVTFAAISQLCKSNASVVQTIPNYD